MNIPETFSLVMPGVYRSNIPNPSHHPFIKTLDLKTALILSSELPPRSILNFLEDQNIQKVF